VPTPTPKTTKRPHKIRLQCLSGFPITSMDGLIDEWTMAFARSVQRLDTLNNDADHTPAPRKL